MAETALLVAGLAVTLTVRAEVEVTTPAGRRILLKDNGTWEYVDVNKKDRTDGKEKGEALLLLERKIDEGTRCRFQVRLTNSLNYEVRSLVLSYSAYRANGLVFDTVSAGVGFNTLKPGESQGREFAFTGIGCKDIARVQVVGGDRCEMDDLHRFSAEKGQCLARVRVVASELVRFDK